MRDDTIAGVELGPALDAKAPLAFDRDAQLATRAAWLYFVGGQTQDKIARKLGITRARVNRLLAQARDQGLVQIQVTGRLAACVGLEQRLAERFGLDDATVVPSPGDEALVAHVIASAAGCALSRRLADGMAVGVGWGRTLRLSLRSMPRKALPRVSVVSLLGGLTRGAAMNPYETASHLADLLDAQCFYVAAPALADSEATRNLLLAQSMVKDVLERAQSVDLALVSVGELGPESTMVQVGLIAPEDAASLGRAGAVGDICVQWIDAQGRIVDHPLNRRAVALSPDRLRAIPCVMLASGGKAKVAAVHGALAGGMVDVLITDERTAAGALAMSGA